MKFFIDTANTDEIKKALHAVTEHIEVFRRGGLHHCPLLAQHEGAGEVFLDRHRQAVLVVGKIDQAETAGADLLFDTVIEQLIAARKSLIGL